MIKSTRELTEVERDVISAMIDFSDQEWAHLKNGLPTALVTKMSDGEMGSIQFETMSTNIRRLSKAICEAEFLDTDGTPVSITLNLDQDNVLFELDVWKVNFKPLITFPRPCDIKFKS